MSDLRPLRVAIVGAGPAGFYAANSLLKHPSRDVQIDIFDRLTTPYGLVRNGVAPDHANIKAVTRAFARTAGKPQVRFFGNVTLGTDLTIADLDAHYDQWLISVGCADDRRLNITGEDLPGSLPAREFVAWYNGHPDYTEPRFTLDRERVGIIGMGNVALDVARILTRSPDELATTDIAEHALRALRTSKVKEVTLFARRGPAQAACTPKELADLGKLAGVDVVVDPADIGLDAHTLPAEPHPNVLENLGLFEEFSRRERTPGNRVIRFAFYASPTAIEGTEHVSGLQIGRTELVQRGERWSATLSDHRSTVPVDLVLRSIGYRGHAVEGLIFDERRGLLASRGARLLDDVDGEPLAKGFAAGWAKRGPSGVIGTNRSCAQETVDEMIALTPNADSELPPADAIVALLAERDVRVVTWTDWERIDAAEVAAGKAVGKPREKITSLDEALDILGD